MANIGNIGGTKGQLPPRVDTTDTQKKSSGKADGATTQASSQAASAQVDSAEIRSDAAMLAKAREAFDNEPQIREDRVAEVQARLASGYYDDPKVIEALAEGLARGLHA